MNIVDELLSVVESVQGRALQESDAGWQSIAELDARIAVAAEGAFPNVPLAACESFGFCRIPINRTIIQTASFIHLMTEPGFLEPSGKWRQAMAILRLTIRQPAAAARPAKPVRTEKGWTPQDVEHRIRLELNCGDAVTEKQYLFATADELENLIGCDRKTAMKTTFWRQDRIALRQAWRRENSTGKRTRKRDI